MLIIGSATASSTDKHALSTRDKTQDTAKSTINVQQEEVIERRQNTFSQPRLRLLQLRQHRMQLRRPLQQPARKVRIIRPHIAQPRLPPRIRDQRRRHALPDIQIVHVLLQIGQRRTHSLVLLRPAHRVRNPSVLREPRRVLLHRVDLEQIEQRLRDPRVERSRVRQGVAVRADARLAHREDEVVELGVAMTAGEGLDHRTAFVEVGVIAFGEEGVAMCGFGETGVSPEENLRVQADADSEDVALSNGRPTEISLGEIRSDMMR